MAARNEGEVLERFDAPLADLVDLLARLQHVLTLGLGVALSEERMTVDQWRIVEAIDRLDSPTMGELAHAIGMSNASLSRAVDQLEDSAAAYRLADADDRRRITVHLSDRGSEWLGRVRVIVAGWEGATRQRLGAQVATPLLDSVRIGLDALQGSGSGIRR
jgi:DNA-binding MarR family transcriptional regulator